MSKTHWKAIALSLLFILSITFLGIGFALVPKKASAQLTSVSQLADVDPTDWYFQALQSMVEEYAVVVPYSDGTFRANRPGTRAEVAQMVNASMNTLRDLVASCGANSNTNEQFATLQKQADDLTLEIAALKQAQKSSRAH